MPAERADSLRTRVPWRAIALAVAALLVLGAAGLLVMSLTDNAMGLLEDPDSEFAAYLMVFLFVMGDAVIAILPGETTLNVASVLASDGELELALVIIAGGVGAVLGDNIVYWLARSLPSLRKAVDKAQEDPRFESARELVDRNSILLILFCRYLPFVRWAVMAGMGALPMPYRKFLLTSAIGGMAWATYTCVVAYTIGTALDEFPLASIAIACASSSILLGAVYFFQVRRRKSHGEAEAG